MVSDYSCIRVSEAEKKFGNKRREIIERNEKYSAPYSYLTAIKNILKQIDNREELNKNK